MTNKERVTRALRHMETDIIPYTVDLFSELREKLTRHLGEGFEQKINNHLTFLSATGFPHEGWVKPGILQDNFGVQWDRTIDKNCGIIYIEDSYCFMVGDILEKYRDSLTPIFIPIGDSEGSESYSGRTFTEMMEKAIGMNIV